VHEWYQFSCFIAIYRTNSQQLSFLSFWHWSSRGSKINRRLGPGKWQEFILKITEKRVGMNSAKLCPIQSSKLNGTGHFLIPWSCTTTYSHLAKAPSDLMTTHTSCYCAWKKQQAKADHCMVNSMIVICIRKCIHEVCVCVKNQTSCLGLPDQFSQIESHMLVLVLKSNLHNTIQVPHISFKSRSTSVKASPIAQCTVSIREEIISL